MVTVFERDAKVGGLLRYGIPDFKLEKKIIDRRIKILEDEGITFKTNAHVGQNLSVETQILMQFFYVAAQQLDEIFLLKEII